MQKTSVTGRYDRQHDLTAWLNDLAAQYAGEHYETRLYGSQWHAEFEFLSRAAAQKFRDRVTWDRPDIRIATEMNTVNEY